MVGIIVVVVVFRERYKCRLDYEQFIQKTELENVSIV